MNKPSKHTWVEVKKMVTGASWSLMFILQLASSQPGSECETTALYLLFTLDIFPALASERALE